MFKLSEIASALQGRLVGPDCDNIGSITTDSRQARPGQIFFALKGKNFDGHNFALEAYRKTNAPVIVEREIKDISQQIIVADTQKALGQLANYYRKKFSPLVIAITGTNGKTTTKNIVGQILSIKDKTLITSGTMNNQIGLPLTLLRLTPEIRYCVLEMGTNSPGEIEQLCRIAQPDVGVLTNIGYGHIGGFKTRNDLIKEKLSLIENLPPHSIAVVNARISYIYTNHRIVTFSLYRNAHYHPTRVILNETGSIFYIGKDRYQTHLLGRVNVENIIGSIALTTELGVKKEIQKTAISALKPEPMRLEPIRIKNYLIINDCYNANPNSVKEAILFISRLKRRRIAVLGDMLELGRMSVKLHRRIGEYVRKHIDLLITIGDQAKLFQGIHFDNRSEAVAYLLDNLKDNDLILFKASRALKMEELVNQFIEHLQ